MKLYNILPVFLIAGVILTSGCISQQLEISGQEVKKDILDKYTLEDVEKHSVNEDCWMALHGKVYDVTDFIASGNHGAAIAQGCGKDATDLFETRPMGSGTPHSDNARSLSEKFYIGDLEEQ